MEIDNSEPVSMLTYGKISLSSASMVSIEYLSETHAGICLLTKSSFGSIEFHIIMFLAKHLSINKSGRTYSSSCVVFGKLNFSLISLLLVFKNMKVNAITAPEQDLSNSFNVCTSLNEVPYEIKLSIM